MVWSIYRTSSVVDSKNNTQRPTTMLHYGESLRLLAFVASPPKHDNHCTTSCQCAERLRASIKGSFHPGKRCPSVPVNEGVLAVPHGIYDARRDAGS